MLDAPRGAPSGSIAYTAPLDGSGNGLTVGAHLLFLAQDEIGAYVGDIRNFRAPKLLGALRIHGARSAK